MKREFIMAQLEETTQIAPPTMGWFRSLPAHAVFRATSYFAALDVLRAIAIVAVVWHHTAASAFADGLARQGFAGVTLFFAISGFLIVTLLLREKSKTGAIFMRGFMIKRALRILPLYYATLLTYVMVVSVLERDDAARSLFFANLPAFATFTTNWFVAIDAPRVIFYFAWSLAAEEQFYLIWPWIERIKLGRPFGDRFGLIMAAGAVLLSPDFIPAWWSNAGPQPLLFAVFSRLPGAIGLGVVLAHMLHDPRLFRWLAPVIGRRGSAIVLLAGAIGLLAGHGALGAFDAAMFDLLCMLLVGAAVIRPDNDLAPLIRLPGIVHIGVVSYGLYLLHMLAANVVKMVGAKAGLSDGVPLFVGTLLLALGLASLSHATFERWFLGLRTRLLPSV